MIKGAFDIAEYALSSSKVRFVRIAHKLANCMNGMRNIRPSYSLSRANYPLFTGK